MLVGQPPFETSTLAETYSRIAHNMYVIPQWVSRPARSLIRQLLAPDPAHRPTLDQVLKHDFFTSGFMPVSLPPSCCSKAPTFASNDSGIKSDGDSTNENTSPLAPHHLRVPSSFQGNRSRPESVKVLRGSKNQQLFKKHSRLSLGGQFLFIFSPFCVFRFPAMVITRVKRINALPEVTV